MSFRIEQYTSESNVNWIKTYSTSFQPTSLTFSTVRVPALVDGSNTYSFNEAGTSFSCSTGSIYYLTAQLSYHYSNSPVSFRNAIIKLVTDDEKNEQYIDEVKIFKPIIDEETGQTVSSQTVLFETIFKPVIDFSKIYICFERPVTDLVRLFNYKESEVSASAIMQDYVEVSNCKISVVNNSNIITNANQIKKLGIQGTPGTLMCINGEPIRIGPNGVYEIKNGYKVNFFNTFLKKATDSFVLDLLVDENVSSG